MFSQRSFVWCGTVAGLVLLVSAMAGGIIPPSWAGPAWEWSEDPLNTQGPDEALLCLRVSNGAKGPLQLSTGTPSGEDLLVFWDNQRGHCTKIQREQVGQLRLMPQRQHLFLSEATLTTWDNGWKTRSLRPEPGGWWVR